MKKLALWAVLATLPAVAVSAMPVSSFLDKTERLQRRGALAMFSSDLRLLKAEIKGASLVVRAEHAAARRAGRQAPFCLPPQASFDSGELLGYFRSIPPAQRARLEVRDAFRSFVVRKYPCRS